MRRARVAAGLAAVVLTGAGCRSHGPLPPASLDTRNDACASCRMTVSNARLAAQIVAPGEEPRFFDDIGCLSAFLKQQPARAEGAAIYVADHRTGEWVLASAATYTRTALDTPMGSRLIAHANEASRNSDSQTEGGQPVAAGAVLTGSIATAEQR